MMLKVTGTVDVKHDSECKPSSLPALKQRLCRSFMHIPEHVFSSGASCAPEFQLTSGSKSAVESRIAVVETMLQVTN